MAKVFAPLMFASRAEKGAFITKTEKQLYDPEAKLFLADRFVVTLADGTKPQPRFAGREDAGKNVWVYFTISLKTKQASEQPPRPDAQAKGSLLAGVQLCDRVLMELNRGQRNVVEVREGAWRRYLTCTEKAQQHVLRPTVEPKERGA